MKWVYDGSTAFDETFDRDGDARAHYQGIVGVLVVDDQLAVREGLARLISNATRVKVLFTDLVSDPALLNRLVTYQAENGRPNSDGPREADLNDLLARMIATNVREGRPTSTTNGVEDSVHDSREKLRAYVGILRTVAKHGS